jgi:hypothetical protein
MTADRGQTTADEAGVILFGGQQSAVGGRLSSFSRHPSF